MISFYPGPSRVYDDVPRFVKAAHRKGILSLNHRSDEFMHLYQKTAALMRAKLAIPADYQVMFTSSATECWEIIAQSLVKEKSLHIFNGAFGEKWFDYTKKIKSAAQAFPFDRETLVSPSKFDDGDLICITQNETSNGTQVANGLIDEYRILNPDHLIAVDATSSMAGIWLDFSAADVWLASVQKCFGLPAGLGILICSPRAIERMNQLNESVHYNSLTLMSSMASKWQTSCTPNVLAIYLLMRVMKEVDHIEMVDARTRSRFASWVNVLEQVEGIQLLITNPAVRSATVLAVTTPGADVSALKTKALKAGFMLGEGYGNLKKDSFRIANFPALKRKEIQKLMRFLLKKR